MSCSTFETISQRITVYYMDRPLQALMGTEHDGRDWKAGEMVPTDVLAWFRSFPLGQSQVTDLERILSVTYDQKNRMFACSWFIGIDDSWKASTGWKDQIGHQVFAIVSPVRVVWTSPNLLYLWIYRFLIDSAIKGCLQHTYFWLPRRLTVL